MSKRTRLRTTEGIAHLASLLAVASTLLVVDVLPGAESNPVAAWLISHGGLLAWALTTPLLVAGAFGLLRVVRRRGEHSDDRLQPWHFGAVLAALLTLDAVGNGWALAMHGSGWTIPWISLGSEICLVASLAGVLFFRQELRHAAAGLASVARDVSRRLSERDASAARSVLMVAILVLAAVSGAVTFGPVPVAENASAASATDDFEDGNNNGWSGGSAVQKSYFGTYSLSTSGSAEWTDGPSVGTAAGTTYTFAFAVEDGHALTKTGIYKGVDQKVTLRDNGGSVNFNVEAGGTLNQETVNVDIYPGSRTFFIAKMDFNSSHARLKLWEAGTGEPSGWNAEVQKGGEWSGGTPRLESDGTASVMYDEVAVNTTLPGAGEKVSGKITNSDGTGLDSATVYLNQSGSIVSSTTTSSDGSYSFSGVSDGDYTVKATASGYQSKETSISVSGSPRTVDLSLVKTGTFVREFKLGSEAIYTYPPQYSVLRVYRFDRAIELPLPGGYEFSAGPGTWKQVKSSEFGLDGTTDVRLEDGEAYRVDVLSIAGGRMTKWTGAGWIADERRSDPWWIRIGPKGTLESTATATPTATGDATATPLPTAGGGTAVPPLNPPRDPFDSDDDGVYYDGDIGNISDPTVGGNISDGFAPRAAGACVLGDGSAGTMVEYWDPGYDTTSIEYQISHDNSSYSGTKDFDTPVGYATWCVGDTLTGNASETTDTVLNGSLVRGGDPFSFNDSLNQSEIDDSPQPGSAGGGLVGGNAGAGAPVTALAIPAVLAVGYAVVRSRRDGPGGGSGGNSGGGIFG
jgi:hypothetical protein